MLRVCLPHFVHISMAREGNESLSSCDESRHCKLRCSPVTNTARKSLMISDTEVSPCCSLKKLLRNSAMHGSLHSGTRCGKKWLCSNPADEWSSFSASLRCNWLLKSLSRMLRLRNLMIVVDGQELRFPTSCHPDRKCFRRSCRTHPRHAAFLRMCFVPAY